MNVPHVFHTYGGEKAMSQKQTNLIQLLRSVRESFLGNPYKDENEVIGRWRLADFLHERIREEVPAHHSDLGWSIELLKSVFGSGFESLITEFLPQLCLAECIDRLRNRFSISVPLPLDHLEKEAKKLYSDTTNLGLDERRAKLVVGLACRHWGVLTRMKAIAGSSKVVRELKAKLWEACFGHRLELGIYYPSVLIERNVMILGDTGTGKELVAKVVLDSLPWNWKNADLQPPRKEQINLAAFPPGIVASQIVGYKKGAFTDARDNFSGVLERANGGGAFFDEVGDLPLDTQVILLRALETGKVLPIGGDTEVEASCRIVSATHINVEENSNFRADLFYRLAGVIIKIPPLKERLSDLSDIAKQIMTQWDERFNESQFQVIQEWCNSDEVQEYEWPGNIREFRRALATKVLECNWSPPRKKAHNVIINNKEDTIPNEKDAVLPAKILQGKATIKELEQWYTQHVLRNNNGNKNKTSNSLNISRNKLNKLLQRDNEFKE